jgi:ferric-dicitrate binding protein FerR (iron transport regulator)
MGHTERGELINIVSDQPKRKMDRYYPLITDSGQEHLVLLPDGTRAWMNAASTIRYPANFGMDTIRLELDGEVFIEVPNNSPHHYRISRFPYSVIVSKDSGVDENPVYKRLENAKRAFVHALPGARLNFSTYPGNHEALVTMISGPAANLDSAGAGKTQLLNGQQVSIINDNLAGAQMIDTAEVIAWAKGEFNFKNAPIQSIAQELERWYEISVVYHGQIPDKGFTLQVPRSTDFSKVLSLMEKQGLHLFKNGSTVNIYF